jgi:RimJ/RimL family protein N-acetyltransferase
VLQELAPQAYGQASALFTGFDYSLSIRAVLAGSSPGRIFVDHPSQPRLAFAMTIEGYLLAGDNQDPASLAALRRFLQEKVFSGKVYLDDNTNMSLAVYPESWESLLPQLLPLHEVEKLERYHYLCTGLKFDWRANLPPGYTVSRFDQALLEDSTVALRDSIVDFDLLEIQWRSLEHFLAKGVGFCVLYDGQVASWCKADCAAAGQMDIGIETHPAHRRRGLAAVTAAATVEHCLANGFQAIGWHCNAINTASWKTAEKVGFLRQREYAYYYYMFDPIDHLAERGWYFFQRGDHEKTRQYYERVFAARQDNPDYYYLLAAVAWAEAGNADKALAYLSAAAQRGSAEHEYIQRVPALSLLHDAAEWPAILKQMEQNAG